MFKRWCLELQRFRNQYKSIAIVNLISLVHGAATGWLSPSVSILQSDATPLNTKITMDELSWIGCLLSVGGIIGNFTFSVLAERCGRKIALIVLALPNLIFWMFLIFSTDVVHLYLARFCAGLTGGGLFVVLPIYVADIADPEVRGKLNGVMSLLVSVGVLCGYILVEVLPVNCIAYVMTGVPIVYLICLTGLPETPAYLMKLGRIEEAKRAVWFYKSYDYLGHQQNTQQMFDRDVKDMELVMSNRAEGFTSSKITRSDLLARDNIRGLAIGVALCVLCQACGCFTIINYAASIFSATGSQMNPSISGIVLGVVQVFGTYVSAILVDSVGRRPLLIISSAGSVVGLSLVGAFAYLHQTTGMDLSSVDWIPVVSLSFVVFISNTGLVCLPFVMLTEMLAPKVRTIGCSLGMIAISGSAFVILKTFPVLTEIIEIYGCMWIFAGCCLVGLCGIVFFVPETKGKVLCDEVMTVVAVVKGVNVPGDKMRF